LLTLLVLLPFAGSLITIMLASKSRNLAGIIAGAVALACHVAVWLLYVPVRDNEVVRSVFEWVPSLGLSVSLRLDGFAWLFALLVSGIGVLEREIGAQLREGAETRVLLCALKGEPHELARADVAPAQTVS